MQHFWSLAVEEQFYVVWPLVLIVLALVRPPAEPPASWPLGPRACWSRRSFLVVGVVLAPLDRGPAFFTTTTRAWELGVGARCSLVAPRRPWPRPDARARTGVGRPGLGRAGGAARRRPLAAHGHRLAGRLGAAADGADGRPLWVGLAGAAHGPVRVLGTAPMVWVGGLSYSIYLWHWPVIILGGWVADASRSHPARVGRGRSSRSARCVPAWLSYRFVESPIHHGPSLRDRAACPARARAWPCPASGVLAALPLLTLRSPFATTPPGGALPPLSQLGAATLASPARPSAYAGRRPRLGDARPAGVGGGPAEGRRRPLPGRRRR